MDNIVRLSRADVDRRDRPEGEARAQSAEIVIFPGVRYERWNGEANDVSVVSPSRSVERDFIEL